MTGLQSAEFSYESANKRRPKLLFLARPFPPLRATSCVRTWNIAKYLSRLGWEVTVVTPDRSHWRHVDDPAETAIQIKREGIHRVLTSHRWRFLEPEGLACDNGGIAWALGGVCRNVARWLQIQPGVGWAKAVDVACASLTPNDVDVILATASPFSSFSLAKGLSDRLGRPYVLDYRDPWTDNPHAISRPSERIICRERQLLAACSAVTIVSPSWAELLERRFGIGNKLHVLTNGYDPEQLATIEPTIFGHFAIVYAGGFYAPKRIITPVFAALKDITETTDWYFHYYGEEASHVRAEAARFGMAERVRLHGSVPRREALSAVRGANISVVITSVQDELTKQDAGILTGKLYESFGLTTPTLVIAPCGSDIDGIVEKTGLAHRFAGSDIDGIKHFIKDVMFDRAPRPKEPQAYAWGTIIEKLDRILRAAPSQWPMQK